MSKITPYFEVNGNRYEFKRTRWLIAEYRRLNEENPLANEDKENAIKASNLVADVKRYAEKEKECWEALCENPTEDNQRIYFLFKGMSDKAIADYNSFIAVNNTLERATKHSIDILERVAIKALAEQYFGMNENLAKQVWESFVETHDDHNTVAQWLQAMAECLFVEDEDEDNDDFLSRMKKDKQNKEFLRKNASKKKR